MKISFRILVSACIFILTFGCSENNQKTRSEIYSEKTAELINDLLKEEENHICDCILEPNNLSMAEIFKSEVPGFEFENYIIEKLSLNSVTEIDSLYGFEEKLVLNFDLISEGIKVVTLKEYDSIFNKYKFEEAMRVFDSTYPNICYFTKPIFDKNFENGLIKFGSGGTCIWRPPSKVKNVQGGWEYDQN